MKFDATPQIEIASNMEQKPLPRVPSNIFTFDALTGGGLPLWKFTILHGNYSSGKTTVSLKILGNFLRLYKDKYVAYLDFESSFDKSWAVNYIDKNDMDRLLIVTPDYGEQGIDFATDLVKNPDVGFLFVDSLAQMIPTTEAENSALDDTVGLQAKLINKLIRRLIPIYSTAKREQRPLGCIFINQERAKIGGRVFGEQTQKAGGYFQGFVAGIDIKFYVKQKDTATETKPAKWVEFGFKIEKSKISGVLPYRSGVFKLALINDVDNGIKIGDSLDTKIVADYAIRYKVITKKNGDYSVGSGLRTIASVEEYFKTKPKEYYDCYNKLVAIISKGSV